MLLSGCKPVQPGLTPSNLAHQIAGADHVTINYEFTNYIPQEANLGLSVRGKEARDIVNAVSSATHLGDTHSAWDMELHFWLGSNHLGMANFQGSSVRVGDIEYWDHSGVLDELYTQKVLPLYVQINNQVISNYIRTNRSLH